MPGMSGKRKFDARKTLVGDDAVGLMAKLLWEIEQIHKQKDEPMLVQMFLSFNAASTAWHLHEWLWKLSNADQQKLLLEAVHAKSPDFQGFKRGLQNESPAMAICRQIATAGKHMLVDHDRPDIYAEVFEKGGDYPDGAIFLVYNEERNRDIDVYAAALTLWLKVYRDLGLKHAEEVGLAATWLDDLHK
jgi:hypothetical protein